MYNLWLLPSIRRLVQDSQLTSFLQKIDRWGMQCIQYRHDYIDLLEGLDVKPELKQSSSPSPRAKTEPLE